MKSSKANVIKIAEMHANISKMPSKLHCV